MSTSAIQIDQQIDAIVIGASAGGHTALNAILPELPPSFTIPIIIAIHIHKSADDARLEVFRQRSRLPVEEPADKAPILAGTVYLAPPDYHLLIEMDREFSLSREEPVHYCRPAIDVLFETAAETYTDHLLGILLSGANEDGANGIHAIKEFGGCTIVQDPQTAEVSIMPQSAIHRTDVDHILPLEAIGPTLAALDHAQEARS